MGGDIHNDVFGDIGSRPESTVPNNYESRDASVEIQRISEALSSIDRSKLDQAGQREYQQIREELQQIQSRIDQLSRRVVNLQKSTTGPGQQIRKEYQQKKQEVIQDTKGIFDDIPLDITPTRPTQPSRSDGGGDVFSDNHTPETITPPTPTRRKDDIFGDIPDEGEMRPRVPTAPIKETTPTQSDVFDDADKSSKKPTPTPKETQAPKAKPIPKTKTPERKQPEPAKDELPEVKKVHVPETKDTQRNNRCKAILELCNARQEELENNQKQLTQERANEIVEEAKKLLSEIEAMRDTDSTSMTGLVGDTWWSVIKLKTDAVKKSRENLPSRPVPTVESEKANLPTGSETVKKRVKEIGVILKKIEQQYERVDLSKYSQRKLLIEETRMIKYNDELDNIFDQNPEMRPEIMRVLNDVYKLRLAIQELLDDEHQKVGEKKKEEKVESSGESDEAKREKRFREITDICEMFESQLQSLAIPSDTLDNILKETVALGEEIDRVRSQESVDGNGKWGDLMWRMAKIKDKAQNRRTGPTPSKNSGDITDPENYPTDGSIPSLLPTDADEGETPEKDEKKENTTKRDRVYRIKDGDTIGDIAKKYGISREALLKANNMAEGDPFYIGNSLIIPPLPSSNLDTGEKPKKSPEKLTIKGLQEKYPDQTFGHYTIQEGDEWEEIKRDFFIEDEGMIQDIKNINNMGEDLTLKPKTEIVVPTKKYNEYWKAKDSEVIIGKQSQKGSATITQEDKEIKIQSGIKGEVTVSENGTVITNVPKDTTVTIKNGEVTTKEKPQQTTEDNPIGIPDNLSPGKQNKTKPEETNKSNESDGQLDQDDIDGLFNE